MKRLCSAILAAGLGAFVFVAASASAGVPARAQLQGYRCQHALDPPDRAISIKPVMRPLPGTRKLAVKVELLERSAGSSTSQTVVRAGDLGVWISPKNPTLGQLPGDVWELKKSVYNLDVPDAYRFRVAFRWTGARGRVLGTAVRYSPTCRERELRPDLLVKALSVGAVANHPNKSLYTAVIANQGATGAGPFVVQFTPGDNSSPIDRTIRFLGAGDTRRESFVGPSCGSAGPSTVTVDATDQVNDYDRDNNQMSVSC
jgi:hypothetical protein